MNAANEEQAAAAFQRAIALHQQGRLDEAAADYHRALEWQPENVLALNLVGVIALQKNDPRSAIDSFSKALALEPENPTLHVSRGTAYSMLDQHEAAIGCFDKAIAVDPETNASTYYNKATSLQRLQRYEAAIASYDHVITLESDLVADAHYGRAAALLELKDYTAAIDSFDKAIALGTSLAAEAQYARGMALYHLKRWDAALSGFDRVVALNPDHATVHFSRGVVLSILRRWDAALNSFGRAIELTPDHAEAFAYRAGALKELGRLEEALESCERALSLNPYCAEAFSSRSAILTALTEWESALTNADRAIALKPDYGQAHFFRSIALAKLKQPEAALVSIDRAIDLMPDYADAHFNRGLIVRPDDNDAALKSFAKALECDPRFTKAYENLGSVLNSLGRSDQAAGVYRKWLEREPTNPIARHMYAAASGDNVPERCAVPYVISMFDEFANSFDAILEGLGYVAPQLLVDALARRVAIGKGCLDILDAGCGTGLCGRLLRATARVLVGVDLSPRMLAKARARNVYDELFEADLGVFMESSPRRFDVVNCADTLIYIGALAQVMAAARRCLRPRGVFAFTVEALPEGTSSPFRLTPQGRYAHSRSYLEEILASTGFSEVECRFIDLRKEDNVNVRGYLFVGSIAD